MLISKIDIVNYIPQRSPFVMIDELMTADEKGFSSTFTFNKDNIFEENGSISESGIIENIAQTCAAGFGYVNSLKGEGKGQLGFIGAISKLKVSGTATSGSSIHTKVSILNTFDNIHLIQGVAESNEKELLSCQMKIVIA